MIKIDIVVAISVFLFFILLLVIGQWLSYNNRKDNGHLTSESRYLFQCPFCTFLFFDYTETNIKKCPSCKSYIGDVDKTENQRNPAAKNHKKIPPYGRPSFP